MKYQLRKTTVTEIEVPAEVTLAVAHYSKVLKAQKKLEALEDELAGWVNQIPTREGLDAYVKITSQMERERELI